MSRILDALKKDMGQANDLSLRLRRVDGIKLYPSPSPEQERELSRLCGRLLGLKAEGDGMSFAFAATASGEGTSFISYNVACLLAAAYDQKVVWVEGNYLSPQMKLMGSKVDTLATLLQDPRRVVDLPDFPQPLLVPAGAELGRFRGLFNEERYAQLLNALRERFDFVIMDLPPVRECSETALMAQEIDGLLLVVEQQFLKWEIINEGVRSLREMGVNVLGAVVNKRRYDLPGVLYKHL